MRLVHLVSETQPLELFRDLAQRATVKLDVYNIYVCMYGVLMG